MSDICTNFIDFDGVDIGEHLLAKKTLIEQYPTLAPWLKTPGLWVWGSNSVGKLGDNTVVNRSSPVQTIAGGSNWKQISSGGSHSGGVKTDGTLWMWGAGGNGQLGDNTLSSKSSPVQTISAGTNWVKVSNGSFHSVAIKCDGTLWTWGSNNGGQLGINQSPITVPRLSSPTQTVSGGNNWKEIAGGRYHTHAIKTDGALWAWGCNTGGELGDGTAANRQSPVQILPGTNNWKSISSHTHSLAIKTDGTLWVWGNGANGKLGDGTAISRSSPVQTVAGGTTWKQVNAGGEHSIAIKTDGTLWTWGYNDGGQLGNNNTISASSPIQTVSGGTNWLKVNAGLNHTTAIKTDGTLWTWGWNGTGQLGTNDTVTRSSPVQTITGGTGWREISAKTATTFAIKDEDDL